MVVVFTYLIYEPNLVVVVIYLYFINTHFVFYLLFERSISMDKATIDQNSQHVETGVPSFHHCGRQKCVSQFNRTKCFRFSLKSMFT